MAEKLDPQQVVTFEELLRSMMYEMEATRRVLVQKGLLTNEEVLEEKRYLPQRRPSTGSGQAKGSKFGKDILTADSLRLTQIGRVRDWKTGN